MKALGSRDSASIRVLSPRIDPPDRAELGSTASTATRIPCPVRSWPKASMKVDLPTPGVPDRPMRSAVRSAGRAATSAWARARWSGRVDSISVIARDRARRWPSSSGCKRSSIGTSGAWFHPQ